MKTASARRGHTQNHSLKDFLDLGSGCIPEVALKVNSVANDQRAGVAELESTIAMDTAISSRCLAIANSAAFSGEARISTLRDAVVRLGFGEVVNIALTVGLIGPWQHEANVYKELWQHSLATGLLAKQLASQLPGLDKNQLYIAGLLHDIGRLLFLAVDSAAYAELCQEQLASTEQEQARYGFDHVALGVAFAQHSKFHDDLVTAIRHHHELDPQRWNLLQAEGCDARPAALVALANIWADQTRSGTPLDSSQIDVASGAISWLRLDATALGYLVQAAHAQYGQVLSSLAISPGRRP